MTRLRDERTPPTEFRRLVHELGMLVLYEATADFGTAPADVPDLRLGDELQRGFDHADTGTQDRNEPHRLG